MSLKIIVLAKQVPDTRNVGPDAMTPEGTVNRAALPAVFNPEDLNALEQALRLKDANPGSTITMITMGLPKAAEVLKEGMSLVVFPEGARTFTGHMGVFRRGAFMLADELQLPVCPLTINGSFDVKPRMKDIYWVFWHPIKLTIHEPIQPIGKGPENIKNQMTKSYDTIMSGLDKEYQGFVENPDQ